MLPIHPSIRACIHHCRHLIHLNFARQAGGGVPLCLLLHSHWGSQSVTGPMRSLSINKHGATQGTRGLLNDKQRLDLQWGENGFLSLSAAWTLQSLTGCRSRVGGGSPLGCVTLLMTVSFRFGHYSVSVFPWSLDHTPLELTLFDGPPQEGRAASTHTSCFLLCPKTSHLPPLHGTRKFPFAGLYSFVEESSFTCLLNVTVKVTHT